MLEQLDMLKCRHAATPGTYSLRKLIDSEELSREDHRLYRRIVGQLLWLSSIRPDIQFAVKELSRGLTSPTEDHRTKMKTLLRYLAGTKPMVDTSTKDHSAFQADNFQHRHLCGLRLGRLRYFKTKHFRNGLVLFWHPDHLSEQDAGDSRTFQWRG